MAEETNEKSRGFEDVIDEEDDVHEVEKIKGRKNQQQKYLKQISNEEIAAQQEHMTDVENKMKQLLQKAEQYASFLVSRQQQQKKSTKQVVQKRRGQYQEEKEEEEQLMKEEDEEDNDNLPTIITSQPKILKAGTLKDYQIIGLNWMVSLYETGLNGILADDMGLGKTIQSISLIGFLKEFKKINGPHLIIAPKSTLGNWFNEFQKWLPCCRTIKLIATKDEREGILENYIQNCKFDVCLTSFEGAKLCSKYLKKISFQYIIIDEAHKIKNEESQTSLILRMFKTNYKILLTGTPLQNNLHELWSLLNFLMPDLFSSSDIFDEWFSANNLSGKNNEENDTKNIEMISQLHKILKPFMMRRTKSEVMQTLPPKKEIHLYVGLTEVQLNIYKNLLSPKKNISDSGDDKKFYLNILMQLRKVCNHPYLFEGVEQEGLPPLGEHIIQNCGKMMVLDKLLTKLKNGKHQVLIFSQMTMVLDILEDYCNFRQFKYCRIDGNTDMNDRDSQISDFVSEDSDKYIFLLSTRAGGLGINLATADTVILYDSDWNPQMDLQAMDRAHRIGQKNIVNVYRMISENTIEEKIIERQTIKLKWDSLIIQQGRLAQKNRVFTREEIKDMIQFGASAIFKSKQGTYTDEDIDILLQRGEQKTKDYNKNIDSKFKTSSEQVGELSLSSINIYDFLQKTTDTNNEKTKEDKEALDEQLARELASELRSRREKKSMNYNINAQFSHLMATAPMPKAAKIIKLPEHQLFIEKEKLQELLQKEEDFKCMSNRAKKAEKDEENSIEDNGLTPKENKLKDQYWATGFPTWLKQEYTSFLQGCERFGKTAYKEIAEHIKTKTEEEVQLYSQAFWARIDMLSEKEKIIKNVERGEQILKQKQIMSELLKERCHLYNNIREEFEFNSAIYNKSKSKFYTTENDKFLIYASYQSGYANWPLIIKEIKTNPLFQFDHFFKSRSEYELNKRLQSLLKVVEKEKDFMIQIETKKQKQKQDQEDRIKEQDLKREQQRQQQILEQQQKVEKVVEQLAQLQQIQQLQQQQQQQQMELLQQQQKVEKAVDNENDTKQTEKLSETPKEPSSSQKESIKKSNSIEQKSSNQQQTSSSAQKSKDISNQSGKSSSQGSSKQNNLKQNSLFSYGVKIDKKISQPIVIDIESDDQDGDDGIKLKKISQPTQSQSSDQNKKQSNSQKESSQQSQSSSHSKDNKGSSSNNINSKKPFDKKDDKSDPAPTKKQKND